MSSELDRVLDALHERGFDSITRDDGFDSASGSVAVPEEYRREPRVGWRKLLPRTYDGGDLNLVPDEVRTVVEEQGWTVQPMGRDDETVTVVVSKHGV
ncbi:hypothetical protein [Haloarchaeobius sp. HRN-SO-5]|uniref:hypothetical protein n=1 Tax=Haloarchaeobius sp. HRN-SO-5 TaxID=3446118 RepID=UPI003EBDB81E